MRKKFAFLWLLFFMAAAVNFYLDLNYFWNYEEKMNIIGQMLNSSSIDTAAEILKQEEAGAQDGHQILSRYGFTDNLRNRLYAEFIQSCIITGIVSIGLLAVLWSAAVMSRRRERAEQEVYFWKLGQCLVQFRGDMYREPPFQFPLLAGYETAVMRVNDELEQLFEQLAAAREQSYKEKESIKRLVTDISHQLKTPVAALDTCLSVLSEPDLEEIHRREFEERCRNEMEGLKILLESLMRVSQMETEMIQVRLEKAPILDTMIHAVNRVYPKASEKQIEFVFDYGKDIESLLVMQDPKWLCEAFINVLDNAVKYSPRESEVVIALRRFISFVRIEVIDSGFGIAKQEYHKIFRRFYRVNDKRVQAESGSGVGLYLSRKIIEKHQGTISVKSNHGAGIVEKGSRFIIQLPFCRDEILEKQS